MRYFVKQGQKGANICPDGITDTYKIPITLSSDGAYIKPDGIYKNVGLIEDLSNHDLESRVDTYNYHETPACNQ